MCESDIYMGISMVIFDGYFDGDIYGDFDGDIYGDFDGDFQWVFRW